MTINRANDCGIANHNGRCRQIRNRQRIVGLWWCQQRSAGWFRLPL